MEINEENCKLIGKGRKVMKLCVDYYPTNSAQETKTSSDLDITKQ